LGAANKVAEVEEDASKTREQSVYAEPIPIPAPKAIDAHLVTGLLKKRRPAKAPPREE
jgi:hypothetical protein